MRSCQRGIALIQVLLVTALLMLLVAQLSLTAKEHVARAQALVDRADAMLLGQTREAELVYALLTQPWAPGEEGVAARWNFLDAPFEMDGARVRIRDENGRLLVPLRGVGDFERLLTVLGVEPERVDRLGRQLIEFQQVRPDGYTADFPVQAVEDLRALPDMDEALLTRLREFVTLYPTPGFNPLTAPDLVLKARLTDAQYAGVLELRASGLLDAWSLQRLTGITADDSTILVPGPALTIEMVTEAHGATFRRVSTVVVRPYLDEAVALWASR